MLRHDLRQNPRCLGNLSFLRGIKMSSDIEHFDDSWIQIKQSIDDLEHQTHLERKVLKR